MRAVSLAVGLVLATMVGTALLPACAATPADAVQAGGPSPAPALAPGPLLPRPPIVDSHVYHRYPDLTAELQDLASSNPETTKLTSIGRSVQGRELWQMEITDFNVPDGAKFAVYIDGGHHGNEQLGMELAVQMIHEAVEGRLSSPEILARYHFFVVPMINPDGNTMDQRANANGVDLNRNYGFQWTDEADHGSGPESEPESHANAENMRAVDKAMGIDLYLSGHTGTNVLIYSWAWTLDQAPDDELLAKIGASANNLTGVNYGQTSVLLYIATGSSKDLGYGELGAPSFTYEVDDQQNRFGTYTTTIAERLSQEVNVCILLVNEVEFMRADLRPVAWASYDTPSGPVVAVTVENRGWGAAENASATLSFTAGGGRVPQPTQVFSLAGENQTKLEFRIDSGGGLQNLTLAFDYHEMLINNSTVNASSHYGNVQVKGSALAILLQSGGGFLLIALVVAAAAVVLEDRFGPGRLRRGLGRVGRRAGSLRGAARRLRPKRSAP
jgi:predicted deacylase